MIGRSPIGTTPISADGKAVSVYTPVPLPPGSVVNERDVLLQSQVRSAGSPSSVVIVTPSSSNFFVDDTTHSPNFIRIGFATVLVDGPFTFSVQGATLSNITLKTADIVFEDMASLTAIVTVTAANNGSPVSGSCIIGKLTAGSQGKDGQDGKDGVGTPGSRGPGHFYATGSPWTDALADSACPVPKQVNDVVTISNKATYALTKTWDGTNWVAMGAVYDGSLFVTGSINAAALNVIRIDALSATLGSFMSGTAGSERSEIGDFGIRTYSLSGARRCTFGKIGS